MAKLNLLTGAISGKLGDYIYSSWRGIPYTHSLPKRNPDYQPSPAQLAQRQKFALATRFANTLGPLLNSSFPDPNRRATGKNAAVSHICKHAITGIAPLLELDYPRLLISQGKLLSALETSATPNAAGQVHFYWRSTGDKSYSANSDKALLAIYCPALQQSVYNTAAADRRADTASLDVSAFSGYTVHSWLGFLSEDGKLAADSVYTSAFLIS